MDAFHSAISGAIPIGDDDSGNLLPKELIDRGCAEDCDRRKVASSNLPRECLLQIVIDKDLHRSPRNLK